MIEKTDLENKGKIKRLYLELCKYVHASYQELQEMSHSKIIFTYDKKLFNKSYIFTNKVIDVALSVLMSFEKRMVGKIQRDELMMRFLEENNCELSLNLLNK